MKKRKKLVWKLFLAFIIFLVLILFTSFLCIYINVNKEIDLSFARSGSSSITKIYYYNKDEFGYSIGDPIELKEEAIFFEKNEWCSYYDIPIDLINAFIAVEDQRFFDHNGVDWRRTLKATANYILNFGKSEFGGSTITQQLIKNLTGDNSHTPKRKIEEIIRAMHLENNIGKFEILELYLNVVYLSENCCGVSAASKTYFNKKLEELTLAECASLAAIVKSPTNYDPYLKPENNLSRRNIVLSLMKNQNMITEEEYINAIDDKIIINEGIENENKAGIYSWYTEAIIDDVVHDLVSKYNLSENAAQMLINKGGLNIYSCIDPSLQKISEEVFKNYKMYLESSDNKYPEASCIIINPYNSDILALIGGVGAKKGNRILNRATDIKRPLGSVIKPLSLYAPAIEYGKIKYSTVFDDVPIENIGTESAWPKNSPNIYRGLVSLEYSIAHSLNTTAVNTLRILSKETSIDFLRNSLEFKNLTDEDYNEAPLALGQLTVGESIKEVANSYSIFQNGGCINRPRTYYEVKDNYGNVLLDNKQSYKRVISNETAAIMNKLLSKVITEGTAKNSLLNGKIEAAGKTGTSSNDYDKWFVGYTPYYLCGVWVGYDIPKSIVFSGKSPSIKLFDAIMTEAHINKNNNIGLYDSKTLFECKYCIDSGDLPTENCKLDMRLNRIKTGYFIKGTEPQESCHIHKETYIDSISGMIASRESNGIFKRRVSLLDYVRDPIFNSIDIKDQKYTIISRTNF